MFSADQQRFLLALARHAVNSAARGQRPMISENLDAIFRQPLGAFVTLKTFGRLRGCIGYTEPAFPLAETIVRCGMSAALHDPRFSPVIPAELEVLTIEISVLSPLREATPEEVVVGTHGLVVEQGRARGLLLPQVPVEWGWDREEFLAETCRKAGLPPDAWRRNATLYTFTAEVFAEEDFAEEPAPGPFDMPLGD